MLNGNEKSTLLEEKKKGINCDLQNHIEPLSMEDQAPLEEAGFTSVLVERRTHRSRGVPFRTAEFLLTASVSLGYNIKMDLN